MAHLGTGPISFTSLSDTYLYFQIIIILSVDILPVLFEYREEANMMALVREGTLPREYSRGQVWGQISGAMFGHSGNTIHKTDKLWTKKGNRKKQ